MGAFALSELAQAFAQIQKRTRLFSPVRDEYIEALVQGADRLRRSKGPRTLGEGSRNRTYFSTEPTRPFEPTPL